MHRPSLHWNSSSAQARFNGFSSSSLQLFSSSPLSQSITKNCNKIRIEKNAIRNWNWNHNQVLMLVEKNYLGGRTIKKLFVVSLWHYIYYSFTLFHIAFPFDGYARAIAALEFIAGAAGRFDAQTPNFIAAIFENTKINLKFL